MLHRFHITKTYRSLIKPINTKFLFRGVVDTCRLQPLSVVAIHCTPGSMNSLFSDFFMEFWRGILGGVRDYLGEVLGGF